MENKSFRRQVIDMGVGQSLTISIDAIGYTTIRTYATDLGFAYNRRYTTTRSRADRTYTITRVS